MKTNSTAYNKGFARAGVKVSSSRFVFIENFVIFTTSKQKSPALAKPRNVICDAKNKQYKLKIIIKNYCMDNIRIGKLIITKKGIIYLCLLSFLYGILLGVTIFVNSVKYSSSSFLLMILLSMIVWKFIKPKILNEISEKNNHIN